MPTPHNAAEKGDIAKTVFMPGDPLRAKFVAEKYFENPTQFNSVRGMLGYTGLYNGKKVSVMGSGMGLPSIGIYSFELFTYYDVDNIIRIGSAGGYSEELKLYDIVLAPDSYSESTYAKCQSGFEGDVILASAALVEKMRASASRLGVPLVEGRIHATDVYYRTIKAEPEYWKKIRDEKNCVAVEMESFALFHNANVTGKNAACINTVSDLLFNLDEVMDNEQREKKLTAMMDVALGVV